MESLRDVKRVMEREIKKGSCPIVFDRMDYGTAPFQYITTEDKLDEVLSYLLRIKSYRQYAEKTVINNVYMDLDLLFRNQQFKRTHSIIEREEIYAKIQRYKKKIQPDYDGRLCLETVRCFFRMPETEKEKCKLVYKGKETYAFIMSDKYILGLFTFCEAARKSVVLDEVGKGRFAGQELEIVRLEAVRDVLFQALLLDSVEYANGEMSAELHTIYCLK